MGIAAPNSPEPPSRKEIRRLVQRRRRVAQERFGYIHQALTHEQSEFLTLLPLLLHINHPSLPGFNGTDTPAGIAGYEPNRYTLLSARRYARSLKHQRRPQRYPPILGLYLIGSSGTLGQDRQSDFDVWVCHDPKLKAAQREALAQKALALEAHAARLGMELHLFILHAEGFRQGQNNALSDESSGNTQHHLLLEEFYRTGLLLAGRPPLWWIVPPEQLPHYRNYCDTLIRKRFIRASDWLDFGGLEDVSLSEFFSAAHWQLFKGIHLPYKSLLKLLLFESFASCFPDIHWFAEEAQAHFHEHEDISAIDVDPYLLMLRRIEAYLIEQKEPQRLELARRALYMKSGVRLSAGRDSWKTAVFKELCSEWDWDEGELINLDHHRQWKLNQVTEERNQLVGELSRSYRLLTMLAREHDELHQIDMRELSLLGRKLYAALERRPGKIDLVNPDISENLHQEEVWMRLHPETRVWQCYLCEPDEDTPSVKSAVSIVEMLAWLNANGVIDTSTRIDLPATENGLPEQEHLRILRVLQQHFPTSRHSAPLGEFAQNAQGRRALMVINALQPIRSHPDGLLTVSQRADPLSFGAQRSNLIASIDYVHENSWGELHISHRAGSGGLLEILCQHLDLFFQHGRAGSLACHCDTPGHGATISIRVSRLADRVLSHFQRHGESARYILQIGEDFHVIDRQRGQFVHHPAGNQTDLLDYLGEVDDHFHPTEIDAAGLQGSALPLVMRRNRPGRIQTCYQVQEKGIQSYVLDSNGALVEQWLPNASETQFLIHQQRFFDTLQNWQFPVNEHDAELPLEFLRLRRERGEWQAQRIDPPVPSGQQYTELILSTGPSGPWIDGFSLLSGHREFNSVELGEHIYRRAADYLVAQRQTNSAYPLYLSGVVSTGIPGELSFSLVELVRFKVRIEHRLNKAVSDNSFYN